MSSPNRPHIKSPQRGHLDLNDQNYAETVYRTVINSDGRVKEQYTQFMNELMIDLSDIFD